MLGFGGRAHSGVQGQNPWSGDWKSFFCFLSSNFLPRCMKCSRGTAMRIPSVCPSVRPSHVWSLTKR